MKNDKTIFHDASGNPIQVLLSWVEYQKLVQGVVQKSPTLLLNNQVKLPNAKGKLLNVDWLVNELMAENIISIPICARAKAFKHFTEAEQTSLEYFVRTRYLGPTNPYSNTMQCTKAVVDALVESGRFARCRDTAHRYGGGKRVGDQFSRPIGCLKLV